MWATEDAPQPREITRSPVTLEVMVAGAPDARRRSRRRLRNPDGYFFFSSRVIVTLLIFTGSVALSPMTSPFAMS